MKTFCSWLRISIPEHAIDMTCTRNPSRHDGDTRAMREVGGKHWVRCLMVVVAIGQLATLPRPEPVWSVQALLLAATKHSTMPPDALLVRPAPRRAHEQRATQPLAG
jgi:hypothetical protein